MKEYKAGLIGKYIKTTHSKEIYAFLFPESQYTNHIIKTQEELDNFFTKKDFSFVNVTNPYKKTVISYLDKTSNTVKKTGACNLIINKKGILTGFNTDYYGFYMMLKKHQIEIKNKTFLILGNGATASTVKCVLEDHGAKSITIACRNIKNPGEILFKDIKNKDIEVIINTTPVGSRVKDKAIIKISDYPKIETFIDVIYHPYRTESMIDAKEQGKGAIGGLDMLIFQAMLTYCLVTKTVIPEIVWNFTKKSLVLRHTNLVFIGLPASGKTTISKKLKQELDIKCLDTDAMIEKALHKKIKTIFKEYGEDFFRETEEILVKQIAKLEGVIISTGGGTIIRKENYKQLARNGIFVYLKKTNFDDFIPDKNRPLVKSKDDIKKLYKQRNPIYEKAADITISAENDMTTIVEEVKSAIFNS